MCCKSAVLTIIGTLMWVEIYLNFGPEVHSHDRKISLRIHVVRGAAYARSSNYQT